jgi:hypothetical protein
VKKLQIADFRSQIERPEPRCSTFQSAICNLRSSIVFLLLTGCSPHPPDLTVDARAHSGLLDQHFTRAYFSLDDAGDDRLVLVNDPIDQKIPGPPGGPLPSVAISPVRQVFFARLHWRAGAGTSAGSVAAVNAVLHWYVYGGPGPGQSIIHYEGVGAVRIDASGSAGRIEIEDGSLKLVEKIGDLVDPLKSFTVNGTFQASLNPGQVDAVIAEVHAAEAAARASNATTKPTTMPTTEPTTDPTTFPTTIPAIP